MEKKLLPIIELQDGRKFEIKRNRFLMAELREMQTDLSMSEEEEKKYVLQEDKNNALEKLSKRKNELYDKYLETFSEEDRELYEKCCVAFEKLVGDIAQMEDVVSLHNKKILDVAEQIVIKALQYDEKGGKIRTEVEANDIWCLYVDEVGKTASTEFVAYTSSYIMGTDESEAPFVAQAKAKAEQKKNMRKGLQMAK